MSVLNRGGAHAHTLFISNFYRHVAFKNLREAAQRKQAEYDELLARYRRLEEISKDKDREVLAMKTDCAFLDPRLFVSPPPPEDQG